jgi:hypothetical protein
MVHQMPWFRPSLLVLSASLSLGAALRPPAVPLVTHDPYFSIWSFYDELTGGPTRHWTGAEQSLAGMARVDGTAYRFLGSWRNAPAPMKQLRLAITPTRTIYEFEQAGVRLGVTFFTPALPGDLDVLSRPVTYVLLEASTADGREHDVTLCFDASATIAVNSNDQALEMSRGKAENLTLLRAGSKAQEVLGRSGDNLRIDWGYFYLAVPAQPGLDTILARADLRNRFSSAGAWPASDYLEPLPASGRNPGLLAVRFDLGRVGGTAVSRRLMLAYDDLFSIQYLNRNLRPWWRRTGTTVTEMLVAADREMPVLLQQARRFDDAITADLRGAGGGDYADIAVLAFRQTLAAHELAADVDNTPLYFSKENFSNGCIATVDVTYPSAPFMLLFNPTLLEAMLTPVFQYASLPRWRFPFAPHDLGTYPLANGQVYGGGEANEDNQMPVEESGNLILLAAALDQARGNTDFARRWWPLLSRWAAYLKEKGMDPENQLCTDDFAGHLAHNANLSAKAIAALGAYAKMAQALGRAAEAAEYGLAARQFAARWVEMAADGDHTVLAFGRPGTWSQKYNLVWDRLLQLHLFPPEVAQREIAWYAKAQKTYGLPLDNRSEYTKLDWILWSATLADSREDFETLVAPVHRFLNESPSRVPMTDWYWTNDAKQRGFQARSVVGGVFIKMLADPALWKKWAARPKF